MQEKFSERKGSKLSLDNYESFIPKNKKFLEKEIKIDLISDEDNLGVLLKDDEKKEDSLRKHSSTGSTSFSKLDEFSDTSCPNSPSNKESIRILNKLYSTPVSNYFLGIDEYFKDILPERLEYSKTGNYITKEEFFKDNQIINKEKNEQNNFSENQPKINLEPDDVLNNTLPKTNTNNQVQNSNPAPLIGAIPVANMQIKGKFDMPMYCLGFYTWDSKLILFIFIFNIFHFFKL